METFGSRFSLDFMDGLTTYHVSLGFAFQKPRKNEKNIPQKVPNSKAKNDQKSPGNPQKILEKSPRKPKETQKKPRKKDHFLKQNHVSSSGTPWKNSN